MFKLSPVDYVFTVDMCFQRCSQETLHLYCPYTVSAHGLVGRIHRGGQEYLVLLVLQQSIVFDQAFLRAVARLTSPVVPFRAPQQSFHNQVTQLSHV